MKEIEAEMVKEMRPTLRKLSILERFASTESGYAYTDAIGLVKRADDMPVHFADVIQKIFN